MDIVALRTFFMWCTLINGALLILSALLLMGAGDWVYRLHRRWFALSRETFTAMVYGFLGIYKVLVITFNLVPFLALAIMT
jgi:hypothetical protein